MGDWNEWNDLQETNDIFDPTTNTNKPETKKTKEILTDVLNEPNKYVYKKRLTLDNDKKITKRITMYSSGGYGNYIVNPLDNTPYNIRVGSKEERQFFTVRFAARTFPDQDNVPITLYYDSPYTYERHHHVSLPMHILQNWENTRLSLSAPSSKSVETTETTQQVIQVK